MKLKMYFLVCGAEVFSGPYFTVEQALRAIENYHAPLRGLLKVMKLNGQFDLIEV